MIETPKVSVIVSVFNGEEYIGRCLDSLRRQSLKDIEILCIDDCSSDSTPDLLVKASADDPRIRVITHDKNRGLGATRNTGIREARAQYVGAVDADDYASPLMFEKLLKGSANGYFDVVSCGFSRVDAFNTVLSRGMTHTHKIESRPANFNIFNSVNPSFWNKIWRRDLFIDNDILFPERLLYEDAATTPLVMLYANSINFIGDCLYYYVQRPGSIINSFGDRHIMEYIRVLDTVKNELVERGVYLDYRSMFDDFARSQFNFLIRNISSNPKMDLSSKTNYVRIVRTISGAYIGFDDYIRDKSGYKQLSVA